MNIKTVRLELLRPGPPYNQLLSPLTEYIALCGDEPPETFRVPFEHYRILRRLQGLRGERRPAEIDNALTELREDVVRMLCSIRCLATSLAEAHGDGADVIELELVLSASELSLIPFEIAFYPGSPTRELAHREVIVMRRSRRVPRSRLRWAHRPRVLVVAASPPGFERVPLEAHVGGIREALDPWLTYLDGHTDSERILRELKKFVTILPNATELAIQEVVQQAAGERRPYTHVHVLAHGGEVAADDGELAEEGSFREPRFGLALHHASDLERRDTLSGRRLFSALAGSDGRCERILPQVVTLASCDSGNVGSVVVPGASVAHDIHDGGVPLVVAAQFPLSYRGSVVFVKRLYEQLLVGDDPRCALRETRRAVHAGARRGLGPVDWGAIVQYGALPDDLSSQIYQARIRALRQRVDAALSSIDPLVTPESKGHLRTAWRKTNEGLAPLEEIQGDADVERYVARVHLRWAFILNEFGPDHPEWIEIFTQEGSGAHLVGVTEEELARKAKEAFELGRKRSLRVFRDGLRRHYRMTRKVVSLVESLLGNFFLNDDIPEGLALTAAVACSEGLQSPNLSKDSRQKLERALIELWVLAPSVERGEVLDSLLSQAVPGGSASGKWFTTILDRQFADTDVLDFRFYSARRQLRRVIDATLGSPRNPEAAELVRARAQSVEVYMKECGVLEKFSAVVDWIEESDGGGRTVAT